MKSSIYIGVTKLSTGKWRAHVRGIEAKKAINLGHYATELDAAIAYNQECRTYNPNALLNRNIIDTVKVISYTRKNWYE